MTNHRGSSPNGDSSSEPTRAARPNSKGEATGSGASDLLGLAEEESQAEEPGVTDENATKKASEEEILAASRAADDERTSRPPQALVKKRRSGDEITRVADEPEDDPPPIDLEPTRKAHDPELIAQSASRSDPSPLPSDLEPTRKAADPTAESVRSQRAVSFLESASTPPEPDAQAHTEEEDDEDPSDLAETKVAPTSSASDSFALPSRPHSSPDPDRTGKLDGLPPFALLEKIEHIPADPDRTSEYVKDSGMADPAEIDPGPLPPTSEPSSPPPSPATETVQTQPPPSRRGFSAAALIWSNLITITVGIVAGVTLAPHLSLPTLEGPRAATIASDSHRPSPAEIPPPAPQIPPPPVAADAGRQAATDGATDSQEPTTATTPVEPLQQLPDRMVLPMSFPPGEDDPASFDDETLRRIAEIIESSRTLRVELIGFASTSEGLGPALAQVVAERRAIAAEDQMRTYGLSRRRFASRAARPDEVADREITRGADGLLRPVIFEVVQR